jgi:hypothetical protein
MAALLFLLAQRRFWAALMSLLSVVTGGAALSAFGVSLDPATMLLTLDLKALLGLGSVAGAGASGLLAAWSLMRPKGK